MIPTMVTTEIGEGVILTSRRDVEALLMRIGDWFIELRGGDLIVRASVPAVGNASGEVLRVPAVQP